VRPATARTALLLLSLAAAAAAQSPAPPAPASEAAAPAATPRDERLRRVQERRKVLETELQALGRKERSLLGDLERLDLEVRLRGEQLREAQLLLDRTHAQMDATVARLRELDASVARARPVLAARARSLYKLGELSYLRLFLSVDRPADFFRGYRFVTALARRDNERLAAFRHDLEAMRTTRAELERRTQEALAQRTDLERARRNLEADRKRKGTLLTQIVEKKETHAAYVKELQAAEGQLGELIAGMAEGEVSVPLTAFKGALPWPVVGRVRTGFGLRKHPHFDTYTVQNGIDIDAPAEAPVAAVHDGTVVFADRFEGYGLMVVLDHGGKHHTLYAHLADVSVRRGQKVAAGETVGTVGTEVDGPGLYFEVRFQGHPEDPLEWLSKGEGHVPTASRIIVP
jgi:septal ring factor EnvC (AmiA/AmiB activator)